MPSKWISLQLVAKVFILCLDLSGAQWLLWIRSPAVIDHFLISEPKDIYF